MPNLHFETLLASPVSQRALALLTSRFGEARFSLLRIRADRTRLARTGWKPGAPSETKMIRTAEWQVEPSPFGTRESADLREVDLENAFVPTLDAYRMLSTTAAGQTRIRVRSFEREESRYLIEGRAVPACFFDLVFVLEKNAQVLISLPRVESYLESRFWAEAFRALETLLELPRNSIRVEIGLETVTGVAEAEEVIFEMKDSIEGIFYDPRIDLADRLRLESGHPAVPKFNVWKNAWAVPEGLERYEKLSEIGKRRKVRVSAQPQPVQIERLGPMTLESLHEKTLFAFHYLCRWFEGDAVTEGRSWADFDLARALVWTAIQSGFLREENYEKWKEGFGSQPFLTGSAEDSALRTLDPLLRTAVFPESSVSVATKLLGDRERSAES